MAGEAFSGNIDPKFIMLAQVFSGNISALKVIIIHKSTGKETSRIYTSSG